MTKACEKVFSTVELLDLILSYIIPQVGSAALRQVFCLQRVNQAFYNHIHGHTRVGRDLFLAPKSQSAKRALVASSDGHTIYNDALKIFEESYLRPRSFSISGSKDKKLLYLKISDKLLDRDLNSRGDLLLVQPPIHRIGIRAVIYLDARTESCTHPKRLTFESGITLRSLFEEARTLLGSYRARAGSFVVFWAEIGRDGQVEIPRFV